MAFWSLSSVRPIDIYSQNCQVFRYCSDEAVVSLEEAVHSCQYASFGGTLRPIDRYACVAEKTRLYLEPVYGLTVDFERLLNRICPKVVTKIAVMAGLREIDAEWASMPLEHSGYVWRLPLEHLQQRYHPQEAFPKD